MMPDDQIKPLPLTPDQQAKSFDAVSEQQRLLDQEFEATADFAKDREGRASDVDADAMQELSVDVVMLRRAITDELIPALERLTESVRELTLAKEAE